MEKVGNLVFHSYDELPEWKKTKIVETEIFDRLVEAVLHPEIDNVFSRAMAEAEKVYPEDSSEQTRMAMAIIRNKHMSTILKLLRDEGDVY
jgi:hypothetical protein